MTIDYKIINGDALEVMKGLPSDSIDCVITDPPYGIDAANKNFGKWATSKMVKSDWDKTTPPVEYFDEIFRVSKHQIIFGGNYFNLPTTRGFIVWDKGAGFKNRDFAECEYIWTSFDRNAKVFTFDPLAAGEYHNGNKIHPTQKPLKLMRWIIQNYTKPADIILDCFAGGFSTLVAAVIERRNSIGIEINQHYCEIGEARIQRALGQPCDIPQRTVERELPLFGV